MLHLVEVRGQCGPDEGHQWTTPVDHTAALAVSLSLFSDREAGGPHRILKQLAAIGFIRGRLSLKLVGSEHSVCGTPVYAAVVYIYIHIYIHSDIFLFCFGRWSLLR